MAVKGPM